MEQKISIMSDILKKIEKDNSIVLLEKLVNEITEKINQNCNLNDKDFQEKLNLLNEISLEFLQYFNILKDKENLFKTILDNLPVMVYLFTNKFEFVTDNVKEILGYTPEEFLNIPIQTIIQDIPEEKQKEIMNAISRRLKGEKFKNEFTIQVKDKYGNLKTFLLIANTVFIDKKPYGLGIAIDITKQKQLEEELKKLAEIDTLTGVFNKIAFSSKLDDLCKLYDRENKEFFLLFMDLNGFKFINDTYGHKLGDKILQEIATRLKSILRSSDIIGRFGGDEFEIIIPTFSKEEDIFKIVNKIIDEIEKPINIDNFEFKITTSIGISIFPKDGKTSLELVKRADIAMYEAKKLSKKSGKSEFVFFYKEFEKQLNELITIEEKLKKALVEKDEIFMVYQPIVDLNTGNIIKLEALIRWNSKEFGFVPPDRFISVAEKTGLIRKIGDFVLNEVVNQIKLWKKDGINVNVAINISPEEFMCKTFLDKFKEVDSEIRKSIFIEITENILLKDTDNVIYKLNKLLELGYELVLDDFGTGYSSLTYLKRFPISTIKIDREFVDGLPNQKDDRSIVIAIISLAKAFDLKVVAEGIESKEQLMFLRDISCEYGQGYLFSKPLKAEEIKPLLIEGYVQP